MRRVTRWSATLFVGVLIASASVGCPGGDRDSGDSGDPDTPTPTEYVWVCVRDVTTTATHPHGARLDTTQNYTGDADVYPVEVVCDLGDAADPAHSTCADATGEKAFCSGDTGYVTLGGSGGWICGRYAAPIEAEDFITPVLCDGEGQGVVEMSICKEANPDSSSCKPCALDPSSCRVPAL